MTESSVLQESVIKQHCKLLCLPTIGAQSSRLADQAEREHHTYLGYLDALLQAELEERERTTVTRRIREAHLPRVKTLEEFDFTQAPQVSPTMIQQLAQGDYITRAEPIVLVDSVSLSPLNAPPQSECHGSGTPRRRSSLLCRFCPQRSLRLTGVPPSTEDPPTERQMLPSRPASINPAS